MSATAKIITPKNRHEIFREIGGAQQILLAADPKLSNDDKLVQLTHGIGILAAWIQINDWKSCRKQLVRVAAFGMGWLNVVSDNPTRLINAERERQKQLLKAGDILFNCDSPITSDKRKIRVLVEELGEVAEAIDVIENASVLTLKRAHDHLRDELTQLTAVCVAWLETAEVKS